jgi:hypothetical protein
MRLVVAAVGSLLCGCALVPLQPRADNEIAVLPTQDGARYVNVRGGRYDSELTLRTRWKRTARQACAGDYAVISEDRSEQKTAGMVSGRTHEGYVRCLDPERAMPDDRSRISSQ